MELIKTNYVDIAEEVVIYNKRTKEWECWTVHDILEWVKSMMERHPGVIIEACSSGGQRMDYKTLLSEHTQDHRYPKSF